MKFTLVMSKSPPFRRGLRIRATGLLDYSLVPVVYCVTRQYTFWLFLPGMTSSCGKCPDSLISSSEDGNKHTSRALHIRQHKNYCFYTLFRMLTHDHFYLGLTCVFDLCRIFDLRPRFMDTNFCFGFRSKPNGKCSCETFIKSFRLFKIY